MNERANKRSKTVLVSGLLGAALVGLLAFGWSRVGREAGEASDRTAYEAMLAAHPFSRRPPAENGEEEEEEKKDRPDLAAEQDFLLTMDPATQTIPIERLYEADRIARQGQVAAEARGGGPIVTEAWEERGPSNVAGRTRAVLFDPGDPNGTKVWAGGVGGGLWYADDINAVTETSGWIAVDDFWANLAISSIAFDPSDPKVMYVGTGEGFYNLDAIRGAGIFKSTDHGLSWTLLPSTQNASFYHTQRIAVHPTTGAVYAATRLGVQRSLDGGASWQNVLGGAASDVEVAADGTVYASIGIFSEGRVYSSASGDGGSWTQLNNGTNGFPNTGQQRIEIAVAPSDSRVVYAVAQSTATAGVAGLYRTDDGGRTWASLTRPVDADPGIGADFSRGQAWYDLSLAVDPNDPNTAFAGAIDLFKTTDAGATWTQISHWYGGFGFPYVHADQHVVAFKPGSSDEILFGNDGGVFQTVNGTEGRPTLVERNGGYNVTQFYAGALGPEAASSQMLAGAQDNGTQYFDGPGVDATIEARGGDGAFTFIDQTDASYAISSYVYNTYSLSRNEGASFPIPLINDTGTGSFINPADYDDREDALYAYRTTSSLYRVTGVTGTSPAVGVLPASFSAPVTHLRVSELAPPGTSTVFAGTSSGRLFKIENAHATPTVTALNGPPVVGAVSCIEIGASEDQLLVTFSNYGVASVWETLDGGATWQNKESNLPDMPVRWALYNPSDRGEVLLATEAGVWETDRFDEPAPAWTPAPGFPIVSTHMLQYRASDGLVMATTHGRGVFTAPFRNHSVANEAGADGVADTHRLSAPAPNPFTVQTRFSLSLREPQQVRVTLLDLQGRRVRVLHEGRLSAGTEHPFEVEGRGLPSGTYVVAVEGERFRDRLRITLVR